MTDVTVPTLGESISEATLGQWLKKAGDAVSVDEPIASLETDKVSVEVPSPVAGVIGELVVAEGDTVQVGAVIARINAGEAAAAPATAAAAPVPAAAPEPAAALAPSVRRAVQETGVDPAQVDGTGKGGRVTKQDVLAAAQAKPAAPVASPAPAANPVPSSAPVAPPAPAGARKEERVRMSRLRQTVASRLKEAQNTAAILTTFNDVDMTAVIAARARYKDMFEKKHGVRLGFMSFFSQAVVLALRDVPAVGASVEGDEIVYRDYADLGIAVSSRCCATLTN